ncbi:hypothetical protein NC652_005131 [Populus alba x Populus x berolinensis]|nr:hypothetical protein NC652_005131 [Populus alba x Populus x berolinensis]
MNDNFSPSHPDVPQVELLQISTIDPNSILPSWWNDQRLIFRLLQRQSGPVMWKPGLLTSILMNSLANLTSWQCVNFFPVKESTAAAYVTSVQENVFECGGNGIGMCTCHKFLDGAALSSFLKAWTATA